MSAGFRCLVMDKKVHKLYEDDLEFWRNKVYSDTKLKHLPDEIKNEIGYYDWILYQGCGDTKRSISTLIKKILKKGDKL